MRCISYLFAANYMQIQDYVEKGDLICLGVMSRQRIPGINAPTFTEQGCDKVVNAKKYEVKFPKGTDKTIVDKLAAICKDIVLNDASYAEVLKVYFAQPLYPDKGTRTLSWQQRRLHSSKKARLFQRAC